MCILNDNLSVPGEKFAFLSCFHFCLLLLSDGHLNGHHISEYGFVLLLHVFLGFPFPSCAVATLSFVCKLTGGQF